MKINLWRSAEGGREVPFIWARDPKGRDPPNDSLRDPRTLTLKPFTLTLTLTLTVGG